MLHSTWRSRSSREAGERGRAQEGAVDGAGGDQRELELLRRRGRLRVRRGRGRGRGLDGRRDAGQPRPPGARRRRARSDDGRQGPQSDGIDGRRPAPPGRVRDRSQNLSRRAERCIGQVRG